jgi:hypothetical protein
MEKRPVFFAKQVCQLRNIRRDPPRWAKFPNFEQVIAVQHPKQFDPAKPG